MVLPAVDLESHRLEWDSQGIEMAANQEKAKRSRRTVADNTKGKAPHKEELLRVHVLEPFRRPVSCVEKRVSSAIFGSAPGV